MAYLAEARTDSMQTRREMDESDRLCLPEGTEPATEVGGGIEMRDEYVAIIVFAIAFILIAIVIALSTHNASAQEVMLTCMNSAIHTNRSLSVEEAAKICWRG